MDCKEDINELLARYFAKEELTGAQQQVLDEWISANRKEFERMQRVVEAPVKKPEPAEVQRGSGMGKGGKQAGEQIVLAGHKAAYRYDDFGSCLCAVRCGSGYGILSAQPGGRIYGICQLGHEAETSVVPDSSEWCFIRMPR